MLLAGNFQRFTICTKILYHSGLLLYKKQKKPPNLTARGLIFFKRGG
jgi:hypothetical protein